MLSGSLKECPALMRQMNIAAEIKAHKETDGEKAADSCLLSMSDLSLSVCLSCEHSAVVSPSFHPLFTAFYWLKARERGWGGLS